MNCGYTYRNFEEKRGLEKIEKTMEIKDHDKHFDSDRKPVTLLWKLAIKSLFSICIHI